MNGSSGLDGGVAGGDRPGPDLLFIEGEKRPQAEHAIRRVDERFTPDSATPSSFKYSAPPPGPGWQDHSQLRADDDRFARQMRPGVIAHLLDQGMGRERRVPLLDIAGQDRRLVGQQEKAALDDFFIRRHGQRQGMGRLAGVQVRFKLSRARAPPITRACRRVLRPWRSFRAACGWFRDQPAPVRW